MMPNECVQITGSYETRVPVKFASVSNRVDDLRPQKRFEASYCFCFIAQLGRKSICGNIQSLVFLIV